MAFSIEEPRAPARSSLRLEGEGESGGNRLWMSVETLIDEGDLIFLVDENEGRRAGSVSGTDYKDRRKDPLPFGSYTCVG